MSRLRLVLITLVLILFVLIVGFVVAAYFFTSATEPVSLPPLPAESVTGNPEVLTGRSAIKELATVSLTPIECTLRFADETYREGTAFSVDGQLRADLLNQHNQVTSLIVVGDVVSIREGMLVRGTSSVAVSGLIGTQVSYTCRPWSVDMSVFSLDVTD